MKARVLVVDDDAQVLALLAKILTKGGYSVLTADSGEEALRNLAEPGAIDLMVLDLSMPKPDGFEILKTMRESRPGLRIVVTSGFLGGALLKASEFLGAVASLPKTEAPARLLQTVNDILR